MHDHMNNTNRKFAHSTIETVQIQGTLVRKELNHRINRIVVALIALAIVAVFAVQVL